MLIPAMSTQGLATGPAVGRGRLLHFRDCEDRWLVGRDMGLGMLASTVFAIRADFCPCPCPERCPSHGRQRALAFFSCRKSIRSLPALRAISDLAQRHAVSTGDMSQGRPRVHL